MTTDIALQFYAVYHDHNLGLLDTLLAPTYVGQVNGREIVGVDAAKGVIQSFLTAFPDIAYTIHDRISAGDRVVTRWTATATHRGPFAGHAPTNKPVTLLGITIFQIDGGRIAALWNTWDLHGLLEQLRAVGD